MMKIKNIAEATSGVQARRWNGAHNSTTVSHGYGHIIEAKNRTVLASSTSTLTESFQCSWTSSSTDYGCMEYQSMDIEDSCGKLEWDCSGTGNTCSVVISTAYFICVFDILYTYIDGTSGASIYTCSNVPSTSKMKSDNYHGSLSNDECNMDEDKFVVYEEIRCGSYGPYAVFTLEFQETGVDPISCTESGSCSSETRSNEKIACVVATSSPSPSGGSSSAYSPSYTGTGSSDVRIPAYTARKAANATGKIAGIVVGVVVTFLIALVKYCCFTNKHETAGEDEENTTPKVTVSVQQQDTERPNESIAMQTMPMELKQKPLK